MAGSPAYRALLDEAWALHIAKNAGYAGADNPDPWANFRMSERFGISALDGCLVRMTDKVIRVENLRRNPDNDRVHEGVRDTLQDLAAYALIAVCLLDEQAAESDGVTEQTAEDIAPPMPEPKPLPDPQPLPKPKVVAKQANNKTPSKQAYTKRNAEYWATRRRPHRAIQQMTAVGQ